MKRVLFLIMLGLFLVSCGTRKPIDVTPVPTLRPYKLTPINAGNVDQIQALYTIHVTDELHPEYLLEISPDKKWVALTPKDSAPLNIQRLKWESDDSFVPMGNGFSTFFLYRTTSLAFSPDAMHIAVANRANNSVLVFDLLDLPDEAKQISLSIGDRPEALTFTKDNQKLIVGTQGGGYGVLQLWDFATASFKQEIAGDTLGNVCSAAISPDGKILAAGSCATFDISTWDVDHGYTPLSQSSGADQIDSAQRNLFAFNPATGELASGADFPRITIYDARTGKISATVTMHPVADSLSASDSVSTLAYTSDGAMLVLDANQQIQLFDAKSGKLLWRHEDPKRIAAVAISADSKLMVSISAGGDLVFWGVPVK